MPIVVQHAPDPTILSQAGYRIGLGEEFQRQQEMAQRERMQERALMANALNQQMSQQYAHYSRMQQMGYGAALDQEADMRYQEQRNMMARQLQEMDAQARMEEIKERDRLQRERALTEMESAGNADMIKFYLGQVEAKNEYVRQMLADGYEFEGDGAQKWAADQAAQAKILEAADVSGLGRAQAIFAHSMRSPYPSMKRPSFQDEAEEQVARLKTNDGREVLVGPARAMSILDDGNNKNKAKEEEKPLSIKERFFTEPDFAVKVMAESAKHAGGFNEKTQSETPATAEDAAQWALKWIELMEKGLKPPAPEYDPATGAIYNPSEPGRRSFGM